MVDIQDIASPYADAFAGLIKSTWQFALIADTLGLPKHEGLSLREWVSKHGGYQRLSIEERRQVVSELPPGTSNRKAAELVGVSDWTVRQDRASARNLAPLAPPVSSTRPENLALRPTSALAEIVSEIPSDVRQIEPEPEHHCDFERRLEACRDWSRRARTIANDYLTRGTKSEVAARAALQQILDLH
jgi:hypothetical protein